MEALGGLYIVFVLFVFVVGILWICMPFAIFGTKPILRSLLEEQRRTTQLLEQIAESTRQPNHSLVSEKYREG